MSELHSESARRTAKVEGQQHLEALRKEGLLGIKRPVKVTASPYVPGSTPPHGAKVVHLVRHGQGFHNLLSDVYRDFGQSIDSTGQSGAKSSPYTRPEVMDPPLTALGRRQAQALQPITRGLEGVRLVVVSPLCRATQTALLGFRHLVHDSGDKRVPFLGNSLIAEHSGVNICDKRRPLTEVKEDFPAVDWSEIKDEEQPGWSDTVREAGRSVSDRGHDFLLWLRDRPEDEVAVVTHSAWLFHLLNTAMECTDPALSEWFLTGELRSMVLSFSEDTSAEPASKRAKTA